MARSCTSMRDGHHTLQHFQDVCRELSRRSEVCRYQLSLCACLKLLQVQPLARVGALAYLLAMHTLLLTCEIGHRSRLLPH